MSVSQLYWNTITPDVRLVLDGFSRTETSGRFYLAGGTALALQLGHRRSLDLDFFSPTEHIPAMRGALAPLLRGAEWTMAACGRLVRRLLAVFHPTLADSAWGNLVYLANNVRVGFYGYGQPLVARLIETEGVRMAGVEDIGLMKLDALLGRAARKDFYDLYFICQKTPLRDLLELAPKKYPGVRDFETQSVKRLVYFANAEGDLDPVLMRPVAWEEVKDYFIHQSKSISSSWQ